MNLRVILGLALAVSLIWAIHFIVAKHTETDSENRFFLWAEGVVFVLLCVGFVLGEAQKIVREGELGLHLGDILTLFGVLIASGLIYKAFTWKR